ncbi:hypothetical protein [Croceicoccus gelatinilyticus]|uniref:hypothetical protein n=1 Tax=Croceicoccus gelatinilyticus TaxID=2835536 RepID=UPI001BCDDF2A|nr:hypothetical protein [Croceicoccus gelatinilyticus]MBS7670582.1 hypothetical protein [Croceicoccus gelatinilyticus]
MSHLRNHAARLLVLACASAALSACASTSSKYPSLAVRDAERMTGSAEPAEPDVTAPVTPPAPPADLPGRLAAIEKMAYASHETFLAREATARAKARSASGAAPGTLAWSDAEVALSSLESARSDTMFALADLDSLLAVGAVDEADSGNPAGLPQIVTLREKVEGLIAAEDAVLESLRGR